MRIKLLFFILISINFLLAQENELANLLNELLLKNPDYQQAVNRYEQEKAFHRIEKSLQWFDLNLIYRDIDNDIFRDERSNYLEKTDIAETDRRWRLELNRTFFPKDFDDEADEINARMRLLRYQQEKILARWACLNEIFRDFINWHEAAEMMQIRQRHLQLLYRENQIWEELYAENIIEPIVLINNLVEIEDKEDDYYDNQEIYDFFLEKYGDRLNEFQQKFSLWSDVDILPDTTAFKQEIKQQIDYLSNESKKISNRIKFDYFHFYLPEVELTLSLNKREIRQTWDINRDGNLKTMKRKQDENFLLGEIELSLPFNIFSNTSGKHAVLKAYERELFFRTENMILDWQKFKVRRLTSLQNYQWEYKRKSRIEELYLRNLQIFQTKYDEEPTLLGDNPQLKLEREIIRTKRAELDARIAEMKLFKEIFLINSSQEDSK